MDTFGDPGWFHHQQIAQLWGLIALRLATSPVVGFNATAYTDKLKGYVRSLEASVLELAGSGIEEAKKKIDLLPLKTAVKHLAKYAEHLDSKASELKRNPTHRVCYFRLLCLNRPRISEIKRVNTAYLQFERSFIGEGLPGRSIYKHVIYAPGTWDGYGGSTLPSIREAVSEGRWAEARDQVGKIAKLFEKASERLL